MTAEDVFRDLFRKLMPQAVSLSIGTVSSVDKKNRTCDVERDGQPTLFNCRLNAVIDTSDQYVVAYPALGSFVLCMSIDEPTNCLVVATSQISEVDIKIGASSVLIDKSDIVLNGGNLGGMVKISDLTAKLNSLVDVFNQHTHPVVGSATYAPTVPAQKFSKDDYENTHVKQ